MGLVTGILTTILFAWVLGGLLSLDQWIPTLLVLAVTGLCLAGFVYFVARKNSRRFALTGLCLVAIGLLIFYQTRKPTHDRDWLVGQEILPTVKINGNAVILENVRDFVYQDGEVSKNYVDMDFDLSHINSVWFGVDRFTEFQPIAHSFVSFGFKDPIGDQTAERFLAISVEARREKTETVYSPIRGIYNHYEMIYVVATERDMLQQRSTALVHPVQLYPMKAGKEQIRKMFLDILDRVNGLSDQPEFYHTIRSNCTNNIVAHANHIGEEQINIWQRDVIFPGYSDWLAYRYGLIDTELNLDEARETYRIDGRASQWNGESDFSSFIRSR